MQFSTGSIIILSLVKRAGLRAVCTLVADKAKDVKSADDIDRIPSFCHPVAECTQISVALGPASITAARAILVEACLSRETICALESRAHMTGLIAKLEGITVRKIILAAWKDIVYCLQQY